MSERIDTTALRAAILCAVGDGRGSALEIEAHESVKAQLDKLPDHRNGGRIRQTYVSNALQSLKRSGHIRHVHGWRLTKKGSM